MKANEAPRKIYMSPAGVLYKDDKQQETDIEYVRTDAFIEKACDAYCKVCKMPNCRSNDCKWISDFKEHLETI